MAYIFNKSKNNFLEYKISFQNLRYTQKINELCFIKF